MGFTDTTDFLKSPGTYCIHPDHHIVRGRKKQYRTRSAHPQNINLQLRKSHSTAAPEVAWNTLTSVMIFLPSLPILRSSSATGSPSGLQGRLATHSSCSFRVGDRHPYHRRGQRAIQQGCPLLLYASRKRPASSSASPHFWQTSEP